MSDADLIPTEASAAPGKKARGWLHELPYVAMLLLTLGGVGYSAMTRDPLRYYWEVVAVLSCGACIFEGWSHAQGGNERWRLIWTQLLHWGAFLAVMALVFLPSVQAIVDTNSTSLAVLLLLALGTFVAGVHAESWRIGLNGVVIALCVPMIAWLDQSALFLSLAALLVVMSGVVGVVLWMRRAR